MLWLTLKKNKNKGLPRGPAGAGLQRRLTDHGDTHQEVIYLTEMSHILWNEGKLFSFSEVMGPSIFCWCSKHHYNSALYLIGIRLE